MAQRVEVFLNAGLKKNEAKLLNCFFEEDKLFSRQIEHKMRMRQPEACTTLKQFVDKGWLKFKKIMPKGKGRPQQLYSLKKGKSDIVAEMLGDMHEEMLKVGKIITELEDFQKTIE